MTLPGPPITTLSGPDHESPINRYTDSTFALSVVAIHTFVYPTGCGTVVDVWDTHSTFCKFICTLSHDDYSPHKRLYQPIYSKVVI